MTSKHNLSIHALATVDHAELTLVLATVDHAELSLVEGGVVMGPGCPGYPIDDPNPQPFGLADFGRPIIVC